MRARSERRCTAALLTLTTLLACVANAQLAPPANAQLGASGFANNDPHPPKASFWAWQWERLRDGLPKPPPQGWNLPAMKTEPALLRSADTNPSVTWIGHATVLL